MKKLILILFICSINQIQSSICRSTGQKTANCFLGCNPESYILPGYEQERREKCMKICQDNGYDRTNGNSIRRGGHTEERCGHPGLDENYYNFYCHCINN